MRKNNKFSFRRFIDKSARKRIQNFSERENIIKESGLPDKVKIHTLVDTITLLLNLFDEYTASHSYRVAYLSEKISRKFNRDEMEHQRVHIAAHLHDIGKISIPSHILNKNTRLTPEEYDMIKEHSRKGYEVISKIPALAPIADIILYHHERFDGTGYPEKIKGSSIPFDSRIIAVADSFDAMTTNRPYHKRLSSDEALHEVLNCAGTQLDPDIAEAFKQVFSELTSELVSDSGQHK